MNREQILESATGVVATSITPFTPSGDIDVPALRQNAELLVEGDSDIIVPCGNTAEHSSLAPDEIRHITRVVVETISGRAVVVVGIGGPLPSAVQLAKDLQDMGVDGVMVHEPSHVHVSHDGVAQYIEAICDAAPDLAVFPYKRNSHIIPDSVLERLLDKENLLGVKYAGTDVRALRDLVQRTQASHPDVAWINGLAETWAPAFHATGAPGFTSGLVNVAPNLSASMRDALRSGNEDEVQAIWERVKPFEYLRAKFNGAYNVPVVKEAAAQLGLCDRSVRLPLTPVAPDDRKVITGILRDWGLL